MVAIADFNRSAETSLSTTSKPASAATCAMPLPIWPEPITPTLLIIPAISSTGSPGFAHIAAGPCCRMKHRRGSVRPRRCFKSSLLSELGQRLGQLGHRLIEIGDQTIVRDLEDRRVLVLVDRDDHLGILHAGEMLDRAGDADRDIEFRRHLLAGLADLPVVRGIAGIDRGARGADAGAELVGERLDILAEVLPALHGAAAGDDDLGRGQLRTVALGDFLTEEAGQARISRRGGALDRCAAAFAGCGKG